MSATRSINSDGADPSFGSSLLHRSSSPLMRIIRPHIYIVFDQNTRSRIHTNCAPHGSDAALSASSSRPRIHGSWRPHFRAIDSVGSTRLPHEYYWTDVPPPPSQSKQGTHRRISSQSMVPLFFKSPFLLFPFPTAGLEPTIQYLRAVVLVMPGDNRHRED